MLTASPETGVAPTTAARSPWPYIAGGAAAGAGLSELFGGGGDDFDTSGAQGYLGQIPDILKKYYDPYRQMVTDPTGQMAMLGRGYKESPGYGFELGQALRAGGQASAAGGMAGSPMQQQMAQQTATGLAGQDYYKYLQNAMGMYMGGARGYGQLGEDISSAMLSQAQLAQLQQEEEAKSRRQRESDIWGTIGEIGGAAAGAAKYI